MLTMLRVMSFSSIDVGSLSLYSEIVFTKQQLLSVRLMASLTFREENQAADLGHGWTGALQTHRLHVLSQRQQRHPSV